MQFGRLHEVLSVNAPITRINCLGITFQFHTHTSVTQKNCFRIICVIMLGLIAILQLLPFPVGDCCWFFVMCPSRVCSCSLNDIRLGASSAEKSCPINCPNLQEHARYCAHGLQGLLGNPSLYLLSSLLVRLPQYVV